MTSILTNTSAMSALQSLATTQRNLAKVQKQISSGLAVSDASDNAGAWSLATNMRADVSALGSVSSSIGLGTSIVGAASTAVSSILTALTSMKSAITSASTAGQSLTSLQTTISAQQQAISGVISSASFNGINLLDGSQSSVNVIDAYYRTSTGSSLGSLGLSTSTLALGGTGTSGTSGGILGTSLTLSSSSTGTGGYSDSVTVGNTTTYNGTFSSKSLLGFALTSSSTTTDISNISQAIDAAITSVTTVGTQLAAYSNVLSGQATAISNLSDNLNTGIGSLVDADMNAASTRLQALQVQQSLGIQALSIANENSSAILKLFGG